MLESLMVVRTDHKERPSTIEYQFEILICIVNFGILGYFPGFQQCKPVNHKAWPSKCFSAGHLSGEVSWLLLLLGGTSIQVNMEQF